MTPIERVRARSEALDVLGLGPHASQMDIRDAWKRVALETHPDQNSGAHADFSKAKAAYDFLKVEVSIVGTPHDSHVPTNAKAGQAVKTVQRPRIKTRTQALTADASAECKALLDAGQTDADQLRKIFDLAPEDDAADVDIAMDHVPVTVHRRGRKLTYVVRAPLAKGRNRVALPTGVLEGNQQVRPMIVSFLSSKSGAGEIKVPSDISASVVPGARGVDIRFATTA